ncbi:hypothetical protein TanjilG_01687 [Lupinus angustifolius]|nr:hypothetical protein TanjilG_01687 [Lupinus angustifolius]
MFFFSHHFITKIEQQGSTNVHYGHLGKDSGSLVYGLIRAKFASFSHGKLDKGCGFGWWRAQVYGCDSALSGCVMTWISDARCGSYSRRMTDMGGWGWRCGHRVVAMRVDVKGDERKWRK